MAGAAAFAFIVTVSACGGNATPAPATPAGGAGGGGAGASTPAASAAGTPAGSAAATPAGGGGGGSVDSTGLDLTPVDKMCTLLTVDEATSLLGKPLSDKPNGLLFKGLGTNCIWQIDSGMADGTYIKVEINSLPYKSNVGLFALIGPMTTFTVAGFDASGIDKGTGSATQSTVAIKLSGGDKDPSMVIQAPTLDIARTVAQKVLGRLGSLK